jgi:predicted nucleic acid-binding protein
MICSVRDERRQLGARKASPAAHRGRDAFSAGPVDVIIAATALGQRITILCDDHDFQNIAAVTGQPVKLVTDI